MNEHQRLKRQLVATAIHQNVELKQGRRPGSARARGLGRRRLALAAITLLLVLGASGAMLSGALLRDSAAVAEVAASSGAPTSGAPNPPEPFRLAALLPTSAPPPLLTVEATRRFTAPAGLDRKVLPLAVRRVVLDPGHGGENRGTTADGLTEKEITLDIATRVRDLLRAADLEVVLTREDDRTLDLDDRVRLANESRGDLFVSIHVNWLITGERGIETFYLGPTDDPRLNELASHENRESGYSLTDFRSLLEGIYVGVRGDESRRLAERVHRSLHRELRGVSSSLVDRGVKTAPFVVLIGTEMPAILAEVSCLSNELELQMLRQPSYRQRIAAALSRGLLGYVEALAHDNLDGQRVVEAKPSAPGAGVSTGAQTDV